MNFTQLALQVRQIGTMLGDYLRELQAAAQDANPNTIRMTTWLENVTAEGWIQTYGFNPHQFGTMPNVPQQP